jgi:hypothetical protein
MIRQPEPTQLLQGAYQPDLLSAHSMIPVNGFIRRLVDQAVAEKLTSSK